MELWIRSQEKDMLIKIDSLLIDDNNNDIYTQCWVGVNLETYTLGKYKTKERALEVLDEIQNKLLKSKYDKASEDYGKHSDYKDILIEISSSNYVYEMPED